MLSSINNQILKGIYLVSTFAYYFLKDSYLNWQNIAVQFEKKCEQ